MCYTVDDEAIMEQVDFRFRRLDGIEEHVWNNDSTYGGKIVSGSRNN